MRYQDLTKVEKVLTLLTDGQPVPSELLTEALAVVAREKAILKARGRRSREFFENHWEPLIGGGEWVHRDHSKLEK